MSSKEPLIGRDRELNLVLDACERGGAVFVRGAAGVGKTRLLNAALTEAAARGARVIRTRFGVLDRDVPYAALRLALLPSLIDTQTLAEVLEAARAELMALTTDAPVVFALDDLHTSDPDTFRVVTLLVAHLANEPVTVLAAMRDGVPDLDSGPRAMIERLEAEGFVSFVDLAELDEAGTAALIHSLVGAAPDDSLVRAVRHAARGNPFFIGEAVRSLRDSARLTIDASAARLTPDIEPVPISARAALLHRIFELGSGPRELVRVLSVFPEISLGRLDLAGELAGLAAADLDDAFDTLVSATLLRPRSEGGFEFSHPIVQATLYDDIGPAQRRRMHRHIADHLQAESSGTVTRSELAVHVAAYAELGDRAASELLAAAAKESIHIAPLTAARWYAQAGVILNEDSPTSARLLAGECLALAIASQSDAAARVGEAALERLPAGNTKVTVASSVIQSLATLGRYDDALAIVRYFPTNRPLPPRVRATRALVLTHADRIGEATEELDGVLSEASDPSSRATALAALAGAAFAQGDLPRCLALLDEHAQLDEQLGPGAHLSSLVLRASYLALAGRLDTATDAIAQAREWAARIGTSAHTPVLGVAQAIADWHAGRWDAVVDTSRAIGVDPARAGVYGALVRVAELSIATDRGAFARAKELVAELDATGLGSSVAAWAIARTSIALGDLDGGRDRLLEGMQMEASAGRRSGRHLLLAAMVEVELALAHDDLASEYSRTLTRLAEASGPWARVLALRCTALATGSLNAAIESAELAAAQGFAVEAARSGLVVGRLTEDDSVAEPHLRGALECFTSVGADPEARRAVSELRRRGLAVPKSRRASSQELTPTEQDLARLVHDGLTNRQIAGVLFLSPKTVEVYLGRVFAKTGCANRLELALAISEGRISIDASDEGKT